MIRDVLKSPEWTRYLFHWQRSNHVVWALVLVFGALFGGPFLTVIVAQLLQIQDLTWLRFVSHGVVMTAIFSVFVPIRWALVLGGALVASDVGEEFYRRLVADNWLAYPVSIVGGVFVALVVVAGFIWVDTARRRSIA